ncbi:MAG: hypothetical protein AAF430_02265 [Myxococcota bacterium]
MIHFLQYILNEHRESLVAPLVDAGFSQPQARQFLPPALTCLTEHLERAGICWNDVDPARSLAAAVPEADLRRVAQEGGIPETLVRPGLGVLYAVLLGLLRSWLESEATTPRRGEGPANGLPTTLTELAAALFGR